ncbi:MAG: FMN-binding negative transcriptional regulator [Bacteroidia bacterium]|nr:FMN-binding negative transcriptional regulator [Bacteroidia bacterium]
MYIPPVFKETDVYKVEAFIRDHGFGILVSANDGVLWASHIPMEITKNGDGSLVLQGHISKANSQWKSFNEDQNMLAIFQGPHTYISPTWYTHENVPTWNYVAVHVYGKVRSLEGEELYASLKSLVDKYETRIKSDFAIENLSEKTLKREMRGIVGFELVIERVEAAFKMSQNRDEVSYRQIIDHLARDGEAENKEVAELMKSICPHDNT